MSEEPSDGRKLPSANLSWPDSAHVGAQILSAMPSGYKGLFAPRLQEQAELRQRERAVKQALAEAAKAEKAAKIAELAPGRRRIVVRHFLSHMPYWSSLEVAFLTLAPGAESDPVGKWREMMHMRLAEAIKAKWPLHRNNELTQLHSKVLMDFNAPSNDPIEIPRAQAAKYLLDLNLPHLTEASFTKAVLDEVQAIGSIPEVRNDILAEDVPIPDCIDKNAPPLSNQQQDILRILSDYGGGPNKRMTRDQIAEALPQGADGFVVPSSESISRAIANLKDRRLIFVKEGRGGGYWLTEAGRNLVTTFDVGPDNSGP